MKSFLQILLLHFQQIPQHRLRSFVWLILSLINPLFYLLFWFAAKKSSPDISFSLSYVATYYLLLIVAKSSLMSHIENDVAIEDIQDGKLVKYLLRPYSYYWLKFCEEIHYRLLQGMYGVIIVFILNILFGNIIRLSADFYTLVLSIVIALLALFISFTFKMTLAMLAFWFTEINWVFELIEISMIIMNGEIVPLDFLPSGLQQVAYVLPFSYMIYFPVLAFQGRLAYAQLLQTIGIQLVWLIIFTILYKIIWRSGVKQFTAVGQ